MTTPADDKGAATLRRPGSTTRPPPAPDDRDRSARHQLLIEVSGRLVELRGEMKGLTRTVVDSRDDQMRELGAVATREAETRGAVDALTVAVASLTSTLERIEAQRDQREAQRAAEHQQREERLVELVLAQREEVARRRAWEDEQRRLRAEDQRALAGAVESVQRQVREAEERRARQAAEEAERLTRERRAQQEAEDAARAAAEERRRHWWGAFWTSPVGKGLGLVLMALFGAAVVLVQRCGG